MVLLKHACHWIIVQHSLDYQQEIKSNFIVNSTFNIDNAKKDIDFDDNDQTKDIGDTAALTQNNSGTSDLEKNTDTDDYNEDVGDNIDSGQSNLNIEDFLLGDETYMRIHRKFDELNNDDLPKEIVINRKKQTHFCYYCPGDISNTQIHRHLRYNNVHNSDSF